MCEMHIVKYMLYVIQFRITCTLCIIEMHLNYACTCISYKVHVHCNAKVETLRSWTFNTSVFRMLSYLHINTSQDVHRLPNLERGNAAFRLKLKKLIWEFNYLSILMSSWQAVKTIAHRSSFAEDHRSVLTNLRAEKLTHMLLTRQGGGKTLNRK